VPNEGEIMTSLMLWPQRETFDVSNSLFREFFTPLTPRGTERTEGFRPATDVLRQGDDAVVRLELPGVDVDRDVTVEVKDSRLVVHGERRDENAGTEPGQSRSVREVRYGGFRRSFSVPRHVTPEDITAEYDAGILTVRITGAYQSRPEQRIPISRRSTATDAVTTHDDSAEQPGS
jgi:HSP20 family molecular chaperone IbpA